MADDSNSEWWQTFFSGLWLEVQRQIWSPEQSRADTDFVERLLRLSPGASVLDVPCGEGRIAVRLASRGYQVTGVDITPENLAEARGKAAERGVEIRLEQRDMRDLPWEDEFEGVVCFWGSFGYFDEQGDKDFLTAASRVLKPGTRFLVQTHVVETLLPRFQERGWNRVGHAGEIIVLEERRYEHEQSRILANWTFMKQGQMEQKTSSIRLYTYRELCRLLEDAGFGECEGYDSVSQEPFKLGAPRLTMVATKM